jgi:hypothetical protein
VEVVHHIVLINLFGVGIQIYCLMVLKKTSLQKTGARGLITTKQVLGGITVPAKSHLSSEWTVPHNAVVGSILY